MNTEQSNGHMHLRRLFDKYEELIAKAERRAAAAFARIEQIAEWNQAKVIEAFQTNKVSDFHLHSSTGYGYNDRGREVLDAIYAQIFGAEAALVRPHFASGTHAIGTALYGVLRPGDHLLYVTGTPYDTLHKVIGKPGDGSGSLQDLGITYSEVDLLADGSVNWDEVEKAITKHTKVIGIQRSRGYAWRRSFTVAEIAEMVQRLRAIRDDLIIFVDNCYGEFIEKTEPTEVDVDLMAGSLIKNPGGGLAPTGGYIAGRSRYVELAAYRHTVPGLGGEVGAMLGATAAMYQGLFLAPHVVGQAVKGSVFAAALFSELGFDISPTVDEVRTDIIQAIRFREAEHLISFVQGIQRASAVDAHVTPEPWPMPGYEHPVIMAAGTFIQGGSLELSADAPIREPYTAYVQGGLSYAHAKLGILTALERLENDGLLST